MRGGIRFRLISTVTILLAIIISVHSFISYNLEKKSILHQMQENAFILSRVLRGSISTVGEIKEKIRVQDLIKMLSLTEGIFEIDIYDEEGKIIFATFERRLGTKAKSPQVYKVLKRGYFLSGFRAYKEELGLEFEEAVFKGFYPLILEGKTRGVVGIAFEIYDYLLADEDTKKVLLKEMEKNARLLGETVAYGVKNIMEIEGLVRVEDLIDTIARDSTFIEEINVFTRDGKIIMSSQRENIGKIVKEKTFSELRLINREGRDFYDISLPIRIAGVERSVNIVYDPQELYADLRQVLNSNILITIVSLLIAILIYFYVGTQLTWPIGRLAKATELISSGDFDHRIEVKSKDELGRLATSFNIMAKSIKEAQERMVQSAKLATIGQLAAGIAHELRNPLSVVKNSIYFINSRLKTKDEKIAKHISMVNREIDVSEKIISDLLSFSRSSTGEELPVQVNEVLEMIFSFLTIPANVAFRKQLSPNLPKVMGDPDQLRQVFLNIILNAVDAMPKGGELKVTTEKRDGMIEITVSDSGTGIPKENLEKLFDPFFTTKSKGSGLGLAISQRIIERHKGTIEVESEVNKGSKFRVRLPIEG